MRCEACGNDYDKCIEVTIAGNKHVFDCFACAIHTLAPSCAHCNVKMIGHGLEADGRFFCCAHCARQMGVQNLEDRPPNESTEPLSSPTTTKSGASTSRA